MRLSGEERVAAWQRNLSVAYRGIGDVSQAQGRLEAADAAFSEYLSICRYLAVLDPSNAAWLRGLAVACLRVARSEKRRSNDEAALKLYEESLRIFTDLMARDPGFATRREDREVVEKELKAFREGQARLRWFLGRAGGP